MKILNLTEFIEINAYSPFGIFLSYLYLFIIGSAIGYVGEVFFRRFFSMKRWTNPGFLKGPCLPLYGFGVCALYFLSSICMKYMCDPNTIPDFYKGEITTSGTLPFYAVAIISVLLIGVALTLIEYLAGIIFVKGMNIKLWDYSKLKGNIQGIICPLFSALWLVGGALYFLLLHPLFCDMVVFLTNHIWGITFLLGAYYALLFVDFYNSCVLSYKLSGQAKKIKVVVDFEKFKLAQNKLHKSEKDIRARAFIENIKESASPITKKIKKIADNVKARMYINNQLPDVNPAKSDETPRTKEERIKKENASSNENDGNK